MKRVLSLYLREDGQQVQWRMEDGEDIPKFALATALIQLQGLVAQLIPPNGDPIQDTGIEWSKRERR